MHLLLFLGAVPTFKERHLFEFAKKKEMHSSESQTLVPCDFGEGISLLNLSFLICMGMTTRRSSLDCCGIR